MMDEFIHWPKPYLLLSATSDEILSWMIEIHMKINKQVIVIATLYIYTRPTLFSQGMTKNIWCTFSVGDTTLRFTDRIEQDS